MGYTEQFRELIKSLEDNNRLNYFKTELLKILDKKEKAEETLSKSIQSYFEDINKTLYGISIEKGRVGTVGEIRTWKDGKKYKKMPNGNWVRVYQQQNRSAEISIARLKGKVKNAQSVDELMNIVMANIHRFEDENGQILPIVEELKKEVASGKARINAGKPSTKEQIEKFNKEKNNKTNRSDSPYTNIKAKNVKVGDKIHYVGGDYEVLSLEDAGSYQEIQISPNRSIQVKKDSDVKLVNEDYTNEYGDRIKNVISKVDSIYNSDKDIHDKIKELRQIKDDESMYFYDMIHDADKGKNYGDDYYQQERVYFNTQYDYLIEKKINPIINELWRNTPEQLEKTRKEQEEKDKKKNALKNKIDSINNNYKYEYTEKEISAAFEQAEPIQKQLEYLTDRRLELIKEISSNDVKVRELRKKIGEPLGRYAISHSYAMENSEEYKNLYEKHESLLDEQKRINESINKADVELDKYMDPIADYYLKMDWDKDDSINNCKTINDVSELIKSKDWYSDKGKESLDLKGVDVECGKEIFKCLERIFAIFPERKDKNTSLDTNYSTGRTWATGSYWSGITLNRYYWKDYNNFEDDYKKSIGFHPENTTLMSIIFHEYYHTITTKNNLAKTIKKKVSKTLNLDDRKSGVKKDDIIRKGISEYATKNEDEFGAEAFGECMNSKKPSAFAREVFKETIKHVKYLKDDRGNLI